MVWQFQVIILQINNYNSGGTLQRFYFSDNAKYYDSALVGANKFYYPGRLYLEELKSKADLEADLQYKYAVALKAKIMDEDGTILYNMITTNGFEFNDNHENIIKVYSGNITDAFSSFQLVGQFSVEYYERDDISISFKVNDLSYDLSKYKCKDVCSVDDGATVVDFFIPIYLTGTTDQGLKVIPLELDSRVLSPVYKYWLIGKDGRDDATNYLKIYRGNSGVLIYDATAGPWTAPNYVVNLAVQDGGIWVEITYLGVHLDNIGDIYYSMRNTGGSGITVYPHTQLKWLIDEFSPIELPTGALSTGINIKTTTYYIGQREFNNFKTLDYFLDPLEKSCGGKFIFMDGSCFLQSITGNTISEGFSNGEMMTDQQKRYFLNIDNSVYFEYTLEAVFGASEATYAWSGTEGDDDDNENYEAPFLLDTTQSATIHGYWEDFLALNRESDFTLILTDTNEDWIILDEIIGYFSIREPISGISIGYEFTDTDYLIIGISKDRIKSELDLKIKWS